MCFKEILERNQVESAGWEHSVISTPAVPFFLEEKYVRKCCALAEIPSDLTEETVSCAAWLLKDPQLRSLAWHLYRLFCVQSSYKAFPDHIDLTGEKTGIVYLIIMFSLYPHLKQRMELEGLPPELADRAMVRCTSLLPNRSVHYPGEKGLQGRALPFMLNYKTIPCFRIGRFDFVLNNMPGSYPEIFRHRVTRAYVGCCRKNWRVDENCVLHSYNDESVPPIGAIEENNTFTGRKIDLVSGRITTETVTLDLNEYERLLPSDANVLLMHIPGGGGMTMECCKASFIEAREFCRKYYPDVKFAAFGCISWAFYPAWRERLPGSNLTKLQKSTLAFPAAATQRSGLYFVFARDDGDPSTYPADNSLRRAMIAEWNEKGTLGSAGMLLPFDEIDNFPLNQ